MEEAKSVKYFNCAKCNAEVNVSVVQSINATGQPEMRTRILNDSLQVTNCQSCGVRIRVEPHFSYVDLQRKSWVAVYPMTKLATWKDCAAAAKQNYDLTFGEKSPVGVREMAEGLRPRITFGWSGIREKVLAAENNLDDVDIELAKAAIMRKFPESPIETATLRFVGVSETEYVFDWIEIETQQALGLHVSVNKNMFRQIKTNPEAWSDLRKEIDNGIFIDMLKFIVKTSNA